MVICLACLAVCGIVVAPASATTQANGVVMATPALAPCVEHVYTKRKSGPSVDVITEAYDADPPGKRAVASCTGIDHLKLTEGIVVATPDTVVMPCDTNDAKGLAGPPTTEIMATGQNTIEVVAITC